MSSISIKGLDSALADVQKKAKGAVKETLIAFYPTSARDVRKIKTNALGKDNSTTYKPFKGKEGVPYRPIRNSLADPGGTRARVGFKWIETNNGVLYDYKEVSSYGSEWTDLMEHGGNGIPGQTAVRITAIEIANDMVKQSRKKSGNKTRKRRGTK